MRWLDTNIVLRFLTNDDPAKARACLELFQRVQRGDEELATSETIVAEVTYVLTSQYGLSHAIPFSSSTFSLSSFFLSPITILL